MSGGVRLGGGLGHEFVVSAVVDYHLAVTERVTRHDDVAVAFEMSYELLVDADLDPVHAVFGVRQ